MGRGRKSARETPASSEGLLPGTVISVQRASAIAALADGPRKCTLRKSLYQDDDGASTLLVVGDRVEVRALSADEGVIEKIAPRRACLSRRQPGSGREQVIVANLDQAVIVASLKEPDFRPRAVDRMLVAAGRGGFAALIVLNKSDLAPEAAFAARAIALYRGLGYRVVLTSSVTAEGLEDLRGELRGKTSVLAGHSGVGKSSLLNALYPGLGLKTGEVSRKWGKGCHTTSSAFWFDLPGGGAIVDTPGIRSFGIAGLDPSDVSVFFPDLAPFADACRFRGCLHGNEPGCAVQSAVAAGKIDRGRYESYLRIVACMDDEED